MSGPDARVVTLSVLGITLVYIYQWPVLACLILQTLVDFELASRSTLWPSSQGESSEILKVKLIL